MTRIGVHNDLHFIASHQSGEIQPGTSLSFQLARNGNTADVPENAVSWRVEHDGKLLNHIKLSALVEGQDLHTSNRPHYGFQLKPETRGMFRVIATGQSRTELAGFSQEWTYTVAESAIPDASYLKEQLIQLRSMVDRILSTLGTVS